MEGAIMTYKVLHGEDSLAPLLWTFFIRDGLSVSETESYKCVSQRGLNTDYVPHELSLDTPVIFYEMKSTVVFKCVNGVQEKTPCLFFDISEKTCCITEELYDILEELYGTDIYFLAKTLDPELALSSVYSEGWLSTFIELRQQV